MPNTKPAAVTRDLLEQKYETAARTSYANYSFFMGVSNDNLDELMKTDIRKVCGFKIFMGSTTGDLLVDDPVALERVFEQAPMLIATHCEDEPTIKSRTELFREKYGDNIDPALHPQIRNAEACYLSSSYAVGLAKKYNTRLHILHITTARELELFSNQLPLANKKITSEVCVHHLYFCDEDYARLGNKIKCNPAIKSAADRDALFRALLDDRLDIIATDHAPHAADEKSRPYFEAPAGLPLVQHSLSIMMDFHFRGLISMEKVVEKMCHSPAICFDVADRGYLDEGKFADIVLIDPDAPNIVARENILYKCGWSPLEGRQFRGKVKHVLLNGTEALTSGGEVIKTGTAERLSFLR